MSRSAAMGSSSGPDAKRQKVEVSPLDASRLVIEENPEPRTCPPAKELVFGKTFTNHMLSINWTKEHGWEEPVIKPYGPLTLAPCATIFHYAPTLFEGLKAYRDPNGKVRLFRPDKNMERMNRSATRISLPNFDGEELIKLLKKLLEIDQEWVPSEPGYSLYIRPTLIGTQESLGVAAPTKAMLFVIMSPVGPYYANGVKPVSLEANPEYVRAWPGGTGEAKLGANYGPAVLPQKLAAGRGYDQILWLYGKEHWLTEVGTMNMFVVLKKDDGVLEVVTPPLNGMILPGVTRASILELLHHHENGSDTLEGVPKIQVNEREINMQELINASEEGTLVEMFGAGTAVVVSPVQRVGFLGKDINVPVGESGFGVVAGAVLKKLTDIQWGKIPHSWSVPISDE
ncbi:branched-chain-amino-acid aminotransferase [Malassezia pachydermatis]|uniref:Branched-chain-amino-acid aminotransferase n=1 Tax=Malassezia pachydermatis TaxID=77020 RepID=A0A0M9VRD5_9BASI|nr:branched-chain-amino-acid aminotransferase [Malassezia pachydermatis]KOS16475.1 branched-chain-amino-acid aminotransferase [Malassezia pachydermatis]